MAPRRRYRNSLRRLLFEPLEERRVLAAGFAEFVDHVFSLEKPVVAVIHRSLVSRYRTEGRIFEVSRDNFEEIRQTILKELKG